MKRLIILLLILSSCTVTKKHLYSEKELKQKLDSTAIANFSTRIDSFKEIEKVYITKPIYNTVTIPLECDEEGNVKPISYNTSSGNNKANAQIKDNSLSLGFDIDSVKQVVKDTYRSTKESDSLRVWQKAQETYKKETKKETVKAEIKLFTHLYCYIVIFLSVLANIYLIYKLVKSKIRLF